MAVKIGVAGWTIPAGERDRFPTEGSSLQRYSARFPVAEINSSFHRPHRLSTWERWGDSVPDSFRFSVKLPKIITHQHKLVDCELAIAEFVAQVRGLGPKLAVLLVQLPPKLQFEASIAKPFFRLLQSATDTPLVCEPRHESWFRPKAEELFREVSVGRVGADPACVPAASRPGDWGDLSYWRLHGSPQIYRSSYADRIEGYARLLTADLRQKRNIWCIFDNTASSMAVPDAIKMAEAISSTD